MIILSLPRNRRQSQNNNDALQKEGDPSIATMTSRAKVDCGGDFLSSAVRYNGSKGDEALKRGKGVVCVKGVEI